MWPDNRHRHRHSSRWPSLLPPAAAAGLESDVCVSAAVAAVEAERKMLIAEDREGVLLMSGVE